MSYHIINNDCSSAFLKPYNFSKENRIPFSPEEIIYNNPDILLGIPELNINYSEIIAGKQISTARGLIDILLITENADIIIIETKLIRNPESHRTVVAQVIDYAKSLSTESANSLIDKLISNTSINNMTLENIRKKPFFELNLEMNIKNGNFMLIVLGDRVHPNVLGMVESIQSSPHLAFTIFLIELMPSVLDTDKIIISPRVLSKTIEIERSVIKIQIDHDNKTHTIEAESPKPEGVGNKPLINQNQFLDSIPQNLRQEVLQLFDKWRSLGGFIYFGTTGISARVYYNGKTTILTIYPDSVGLLSEKVRQSQNIEDEDYNIYIDELKKSEKVYDYFVANKVFIPINELTLEDIKQLFDTSLVLAKILIKKEQNDN